jgi:hypothetical protein
MVELITRIRGEAVDNFVRNNGYSCIKTLADRLEATDAIWKSLGLSYLDDEL